MKLKLVGILIMLSSMFLFAIGDPPLSNCNYNMTYYNGTACKDLVQPASGSFDHFCSYYYCDLFRACSFVGTKVERSRRVYIAGSPPQYSTDGSVSDADIDCCNCVTSYQSPPPQ
jgi:hypothetical protein